MSKNRHNVSGLLLLDKPRGLTSNQALQDVKYLLKAKKAGHTGSLDPLATGLLPLCFGEATKLSSYLLDSDKTYLATFKLGETTDTYDSDGEVTQMLAVNVSKQKLVDAMEKFVGVIHQVPPMYSALKKDGKPLYELAREGIEIKREARKMELHRFELIDYTDEQADVLIKCSSGFYVRSLAYDLGEELGCGAHVKALRRTMVGNLSVNDAITVDQLKKMPEPVKRQNLLKPADQVLSHLVALELNKNQVERLFKGQPIPKNGLPANGLVRLYLDSTDQFLGIGLIVQGHSVKPKRLINPANLDIKV